jgi:hypothetical protein
MPRLNKLEDLIFPVEESPVFARINTKDGEKTITVPDKKAIVNMNTGRVLGVVSRSYRLVSNREALDMASECCRSVFPETKPGEWVVKATDAPSTGGHCFIDLEHNSTKLDFTFVPAQDRPDVFGPFIRVTNSYNGLRALSFDIGFYRKVCKNGLILPELVIRFKFTHLLREIRQTIRFEIAHERLAKLKVSFEEYLGVLRDYPVRRDQFEPLVFTVLAINKPKHAKQGNPEARDWDTLCRHVNAICDRYADDLGETAYAVFNAITEFASNAPENRCIYRDRNSLQRRAGTWMNDFSRVCREPGFELDKYMEKISKSDGDGAETGVRTHGRGA